MVKDKIKGGKIWLRRFPRPSKVTSSWNFFHISQSNEFMDFFFISLKLLDFWTKMQLADLIKSDFGFYFECSIFIKIDPTYFFYLKSFRLFYFCQRNHSQLTFPP